MSHGYNDIISLENLCLAWQEFVRGKKFKKDVAEFSLDLAGNLFSLYEDLRNKSYQHGAYGEFGISDPKPRVIHKATVRDRVLHHAIYRILYPLLDTKFIGDVYSCRNEKGTHRAMDRLKRFAFKVSRNNTRTCWILKCDIKKFFASINQRTLLDVIAKHIHDRDTLWLIERVVISFESASGKGLPLGNLTSQLLANVYMNELDQFVKHHIKAEYYIRYADDFVVLSPDREWLGAVLREMEVFLYECLKLQLHPDKVFIKTLASGVDFLGWVHFSDHRVLRTATKRRMLKRIACEPSPETLASYRGMLVHGNAHNLQMSMPDDPC